MKNQIYFTSNSFRSIHSLWKSNLFKEYQITSGSFVNLVVSEVSKQNICLYEVTNEKIEKRHMTPWFNHIGLRDDYESDIIHDLYLIHELYHIAYLPKVDNIIDNFEDWKKEMWKNELMSSLSTEVFIYAWMPELRNLTFDFEIWFDLLKTQYGFDFENIVLNKNDVFSPEKNNTLNEIINLRLEFRNGKEATNSSEEWFVRYNNYDKWFERWKDNFIDVQDLRRLFHDDFDLFKEKAESHTKDEIIFNFNKA